MKKGGTKGVLGRNERKGKERTITIPIQVREGRKHRRRRRGREHRDKER